MSGADEPMDTSLPPEDRAGEKEEPMDTEAASKPHPSASTPVSQNSPGFVLERTLSIPSQPEFSHVCVSLFIHVVVLELHPSLCFIHFIINQLIVALNVTENCIHNFKVFKYPVNNDVKQRKSAKPLVCLVRIRMFDKLIVLLD